MGLTGCAQNANSNWESTLDINVSYTGYKVTFAGVEIIPNMDLQTIINLLANGISDVEKNAYSPFIKKDNTLTFDMTFAQINIKYPEMPIGGIVYNAIDGFEYMKLSGTEFKYSIIEIR